VFLLLVLGRIKKKKKNQRPYINSLEHRANFFSKSEVCTVLQEAVVLDPFFPLCSAPVKHCPETWINPILWEKGPGCNDDILFQTPFLTQLYTTALFSFTDLYASGRKS